MKKITIIASSVRNGRLSNRIALYFKELLNSENIGDVDILDLKEFDFPIFNERYQFQAVRSEKLEDFTLRLFESDLILVVTPVYNGSYPAALKNVIDLYSSEWKHKKVGIIGVTAGGIPPFTTIAELQTLFLKLGCLVIPTYATYTLIGTMFDENGRVLKSDFVASLTKPFLADLKWFISLN